MKWRRSDPSEILFEKRQAYRALKEKQDLVRNNAADNLRELQAKVGKTTNTTEKVSGKKWAPVKTVGTKGVGVSKSGYSTKPVPLPGMSKKPITSLPSGLKKGGFKIGGLKGVAAGVIGSGIAGVLKKNRKEKDQDFWNTYDSITAGLGMGLSLVNPVAGALAAPVMEVLGQWGNALADNGYNHLGMAGEFDFYEDWVNYRKNPANDGVSLPEYQRRRRVAEEELKKDLGECTPVQETREPNTTLTPGTIPSM